MHQFASFVISMLFYDYHQYQQEYSSQYLLGAVVGILLVGALAGNILRHSLYLTIAGLHLILIGYIIMSFQLDETISKNETLRIVIATALGCVLETSNFIYSCLLPLKIAKDITELKLKQFSRQHLDPNTHSFVGTVVGVLLGATFIADTIVFANLNFLMQRLNEVPPQWVCAVICIMVAMSIIVLYKELKRELLRFPCIRRCFPKKLRSYTRSH